MIYFLPAAHPYNKLAIHVIDLCTIVYAITRIMYVIACNAIYIMVQRCIGVHAIRTEVEYTCYTCNTLLYHYIYARNNTTTTEPCT